MDDNVGMIIEEHPAEPFEEITFHRRVVLEKSLKWHPQAPCRNKTHWPTSSVRRSMSVEDFAEQLCRSCPFARKCLNVALVFKDTEAVVWGGLTGEQRSVLIGDLLASDPDLYRFWSADKWDPLESTCRHASLSIL